MYLIAQHFYFISLFRRRNLRCNITC